MSSSVVVRTNIPDFPLIARGKVRDIYAIDEETLLFVTTDRMSAFDVVLDDPIPGKGIILNQLSLFWMRRFTHLLPNQILQSEVDRYPAMLKPYRDQLERRSVLARRAKPLPIECVVRGYLSGSCWKSYSETGEVSGHKVPAGLLDSSPLPEPIFTPSTKAEAGAHDENISMRRAEEIAGVDVARRAAELSLSMYREASEYAAGRGIIIADTKFEFGMIDDTLVLIDEVLTPDSSRFWPAEGYTAGKGQPSYDKQYLRDWLERQPWDKTSPAPRLPEEIIATTAQKYQEAYLAITGEKL